MENKFLVIPVQDSETGHTFTDHVVIKLTEKLCDRLRKLKTMISGEFYQLFFEKEVYFDWNYLVIDAGEDEILQPYLEQINSQKPFLLDIPFEEDQVQEADFDTTHLGVQLYGEKYFFVCRGRMQADGPVHYDGAVSWEQLEELWPVLKTVDAFTGLPDPLDSEMREKGKRFLILENPEWEDEFQIFENPTEEEKGDISNSIAWESFVMMIAESAQQARERFHDAHDQWYNYENGNPDWVNVVNLPVEERR